MELLKSKNIFLLLLVFASVLFRLVPHPMNFTPLLAVALFSGAFIENKKLALLAPLLALLLSDLYLGFSTISLAVYASIVLIAALAIPMEKIKARSSVFKYSGMAFLASVLFFAITNAAVWNMGILYPQTFVGLIECYVAALPFFHNTLLSTFIYGAGLLALKKLVIQPKPVLQN